MAGNKALVVLAALTGLVAGCGAPSPRVDGASAAAEAFRSAVAGQDSAAVCALLTGPVVSELATAGKPCTAAVDELGLEDPGRLEQVDVWGRAALARFGASDLFLTEVDGVWRVTAAGCRARPEAPADCEVGG